MKIAFLGMIEHKRLFRNGVATVRVALKHLLQMAPAAEESVEQQAARKIVEYRYKP
jgi:hypothetical protein|tara:strand:+ start:1858 stop:2025 length:168 start_codon:yes stop_codon:yes gene_type:complete